MAKAGTVVIELDANTAKLVQGVKRTEKEVNTLKRSVGKAKSDIVNFAKAAASIYVVAKAFEAVKDAAYSMVEISAEFETFNTTLTSIEGSSEKARESMKWITDFTAQTPYQLAQVTESFVKLRAYGIEPTEGMLKTLGDTSSAMGKPIQQAVEAMADAITGENERLKEFGIKASKQGEEIAYSWTDSSGQTKEIIVANNKEIIESTLTAIFNEKYAGAMDAQSKTWNGIISNIKDSWTIFQKEIMGAGLFEYLKAIAMTIKDYLGGMFEKGKEGAAEFSKMVIDGIKSTISSFGFLSDVIDGIKLGFKGVEYAVLFMAKAVMQAVNLPITALNKMIELYNKVVSKLGGDPIKAKIEPFIDTTWTDNAMNTIKKEMGDIVEKLASDSGAKFADQMIQGIEKNLAKLNEAQDENNKLKEEANEYLAANGAITKETTELLGQATDAEIEAIYAAEMMVAAKNGEADAVESASDVIKENAERYRESISPIREYTEAVKEAASASYGIGTNQVKSYSRVLTPEEQWLQDTNPFADYVGTVFDPLGNLSGFATGGYTGDISTSDIAGVVHGQEYVVDAKTTRDLGLNGEGGTFKSIDDKLDLLRGIPEMIGTMKKLLNVQKQSYSIQVAGDM